MIFTICVMRQIYWLVAMSIMCSVSGRGIDNLREAAETEPTVDDNKNHERRQEETVCGRTQILTSKRDEGTGGSNDQDQSDHLDKILGGSDVTYGQVPWHVKILRDGRRKCGGAIITEFWVITAASCVSEARRRDIKVVVGDHRLSHQDAGEQEYSVRRVVVHANYTIPHTQSSDTLQTAVLPVISHSQCVEHLRAEDITERVLCAWRTDGVDTDVCVTDYGGPAAYQSGDTHILAGIIIFGSMCMPPISPALLTNVAVLRTWIDDRIDEFSNSRQGVIPTRAY